MHIKKFNEASYSANSFINKDELPLLIEGFINDDYEVSDGVYTIDENYLKYLKSYLDLKSREVSNVKKYFGSTMSNLKMISRDTFTCNLTINDNKIFIYGGFNSEPYIILIANDNNSNNKIHDDDIRDYIGDQFKTIKL